MVDLQRETAFADWTLAVLALDRSRPPEAERQLADWWSAMLDLARSKPLEVEKALAWRKLLAANEEDLPEELLKECDDSSSRDFCLK